MQDYPLTLHNGFWRREKLFGPREVVTCREHGVHRYTNAEMARRVYRLAKALRRLGVRPGDRVGTLAWNNYRHLELYYAVPLLGAVLHTLNMRLFSTQLEFVIRDGGDRFIFVDASLIAQEPESCDFPRAVRLQRLPPAARLVVRVMAAAGRRSMRV